MFVEVIFLALLVAAIIDMALGFFWYGPLFGKQWMALSGITPQQITEKSKAKKSEMNKLYFMAFIGALVMSYVLAVMIVFAQSYLIGAYSGVILGLKVGFLVWLGFIAPVLLGSVLWEGKPWKLYFLNIGYYLAVLLINGVVLASWM